MNRKDNVIEFRPRPKQDDNSKPRKKKGGPPSFNIWHLVILLVFAGFILASF